MPRPRPSPASRRCASRASSPRSPTRRWTTRRSAAGTRASPTRAARPAWSRSRTCRRRRRRKRWRRCAPKASGHCPRRPSSPAARRRSPSATLRIPHGVRASSPARVPDDYDDTARALGLYPLTRVGFALGVRAYEQAVMDRFAVARAGSGDARRLRAGRAAGAVGCGGAGAARARRERSAGHPRARRARRRAAARDLRAGPRGRRARCERSPRPPGPGAGRHGRVRADARRVRPRRVHALRRRHARAAGLHRVVRRADAAPIRATCSPAGSTACCGA